MNPALRRYTMSNSVMHSNYVTKKFDFYSGMQHIHVRMHHYSQGQRNRWQRYKLFCEIQAVRYKMFCDSAKFTTIGRQTSNANAISGESPYGTPRVIML